MAAAGFRHLIARSLQTFDGPPYPSTAEPGWGAPVCRRGAFLDYSGGGQNRQDGQGGGGLSGGAGIVHGRVADAMRQGRQLKRPQHRDDGIGRDQRRQGREIECRQMLKHNGLLIFPGACSCSDFFLRLSENPEERNTNLTQLPSIYLLHINHIS